MKRSSLTRWMFMISCVACEVVAEEGVRGVAIRILRPLPNWGVVTAEVDLFLCLWIRVDPGNKNLGKPPSPFASLARPLRRCNGNRRGDPGDTVVVSSNYLSPTRSEAVD